MQHPVTKHSTHLNNSFIKSTRIRACSMLTPILFHSNAMNHCCHRDQLLSVSGMREGDQRAEPFAAHVPTSAPERFR
jgi:hypothetical protein